MTVATLLELASELPFEDLDYLGDEVGQITGGFFNEMCNPDPEVISRIKRKTVFSVTYESGKYGEVVAIFYLDNEPVVLVTFGGKWVSPVSAYVINPELHKKLVGLIAEHHVQMMTSVNLLTDEHIEPIGSRSRHYFKGNPLDKEHFPVKINGDHLDYIR